MTNEHLTETVRKGAAANCYWNKGCTRDFHGCTYCIGFYAGLDTGVQLAKEAAGAQIGLAVGFPGDHDGSRRERWTARRILSAIDDLIRRLKR